MVVPRTDRTEVGIRLAPYYLPNGLGDPHARRHLPAAVDGAFRPGELDRQNRERVAARPAEPQLDAAGFDDALPSQAGKGGQVGVQFELDPAPLARLQRHARVADELDNRPGYLGNRVVQVDLDDLSSCV